MMYCNTLVRCATSCKLQHCSVYGLVGGWGTNPPKTSWNGVQDTLYKDTLWVHPVFQALKVSFLRYDFSMTVPEFHIFNVFSLRNPAFGPKGFVTVPADGALCLLLTAVGGW